MRVFNSMRNDYNVRYDFIRIVSMAMIVAIHVSAPLVVKYGDVSIISWSVSNFVDAFCRMSIDIFIMLSGCLLLSKDEGIKKFYSKRLNKIVIPFVFWSIFYTFWGRYFKGYDMSIKQTLLGAYNVQTYYHLWFLYAIIALYIVTPFFRFVCKKIPNNVLLIICFLWLLLLTPNFLNRFYMFKGNIPSIKWSYTSFDYIIEYGAYFVLGYVLISYLQSLTKKKIIIFGIATFLSNFLIFIGTSYLSNRNAGFDGRLYYSPSFFVAISSICGYIFLYGISDIYFKKLEKHKTFIKIASNCSFGVYLLHICILEIILSTSLGNNLLFGVNSIISLPIFIIIIIFICTTIVYLCKKIPILKHIF